MTTLRLRYGIIVTGFLVATTAAFAHEGATGIVKERMEAMSNLGAAMKSLSKIVKGRVAYDAVMYQKLTDQLERHGGANLTKLFPKGSLDKPTAAIPEIWQDWNKFNSFAKSLSQRAKEMSMIAQNKSIQPENRIDAMTKAYKNVGKICSACHRDFRKEKKR
jgi:cytochrome c556